MGGAWNTGADGVTDSVDESTVLLGQFNGSQGIGGLTALGDSNHHITFAHHRIPVTELRCIFNLYGDTTEVLDDLLTDETGVPGCTASHDDDTLGIQQLFLMIDDSTECYMSSFHIDSSTHTVGETLRLLEDLLEHEMRIATLLNLTQVDINGLDLRGKLGVVDVDHLQFLTALDHSDVPVLEIYHTVGIFDNRTGVGTDEELIFADTYHQRTLLSGRDDGIGITLVENGNGIGTDHLMQHQLDSGEQIEVLLYLHVFHELHQHLRIGITPERHTLLLQFPLQVGIVLNDTIMDDGQVLRL